MSLLFRLSQERYWYPRRLAAVAGQPRRGLGAGAPSTHDPVVSAATPEETRTGLSHRQSFSEGREEEE